ncbi:MAG TPA: GNAT family N-acetyltransferase [Firmicutes bacterium]|jgi:ribosomal protein S18 acetylase RimI-like enzyme|nr:GNAT family N-acetyltransferase [Bacillota bacterium]
MIGQIELIRPAELNDLEPIMKVIRSVCQEMQREGNNQWDENYPQAADFIKDIGQKELYVSQINGLVSGFICINDYEPEEYARIHWSCNQKLMVLHRMAVAPDFRNQGIGAMLLRFAEQLAQKSGVHYLRTDTNSLNVKMNGLFRKLGFTFVGQMEAFGKEVPFNFYDKVLASSSANKSEL